LSVARARPDPPGPPATLDAAGDVPRSREIAAGMALVDAQIVAAMRRTVSNERVTFNLRP